MSMGVYRVDTILQRGTYTHPKWMALLIPTCLDRRKTWQCGSYPQNRSEVICNEEKPLD